MRAHIRQTAQRFVCFPRLPDAFFPPVGVGESPGVGCLARSQMGCVFETPLSKSAPLSIHEQDAQPLPARFIKQQIAPTRFV